MSQCDIKVSQCDIEISQRDIKILPTIVKKSVTSKDNDSIAYVWLRKTGPQISKPKLKECKYNISRKTNENLEKRKEKNGVARYCHFDNTAD